MSTASTASVLAVVMISPIDTASSGPWATAASPGPYCTVGIPPNPVNSRRSLPYGAPYTSGRDFADGGVGGGGALDEIATGRDAAGSELTTPPLDLDRMVSQPGVTLTHLRDGPFELHAGMLDVLADGDAEAPSATSRSGTDDAQSPARIVPMEIGWASDQRPSAGRHRCSVVVRGRSALPDRPEPLDRAHALLPPCRMRRQAVDVETEGQRPELAGMMSSEVGSGMTHASAPQPR